MYQVSALDWCAQRARPWNHGVSVGLGLEVADMLVHETAKDMHQVDYSSDAHQRESDPSAMHQDVVEVCQGPAVNWCANGAGNLHHVVSAAKVVDMLVLKGLRICIRGLLKCVKDL